jgi:hypothetical protein
MWCNYFSAAMFWFLKRDLISLVILLFYCYFFQSGSYAYVINANAYQPKSILPKRMELTLHSGISFGKKIVILDPKVDLSLQAPVVPLVDVDQPDQSPWITNESNGDLMEDGLSRDEVRRLQDEELAAKIKAASDEVYKDGYVWTVAYCTQRASLANIHRPEPVLFYRPSSEQTSSPTPTKPWGIKEWRRQWVRSTTTIGSE